MTYEERKALVKSYLGKTVDIKIDRPIGYVHKKENYSLTYPINYGYIPGVLGGDGEELDVYLLGVNEPVTEYTCKIIGIAHRENDVEDKLIAAPEGMTFNQAEIAEKTHFQEQYYKTSIEALYQKSCGAVVYTVLDGRIKYLLIKSPNGHIGFPKGHIEQGESEKETALREIFEETSISAEITTDFKEKVEYIMPNSKHKTVVYYIAFFENQEPHHNDGFEDNEYFMLEYDAALKVLTFDNTKETLTKANAIIAKKILGVKYLKLNSNSTNFQKKEFERLVLLYGAELDSHQNRKTPDEVLSKWANSMINIQDDDDRHLELCYNGDNLIGFLYGKIDHPEHKGFIKAGYGYIMEFYVLPEFRRNGYGKQMYAHLEKMLINDGAKGLYLTSDPVTGKPFWLACGYKNTGKKSPENNQEIYEKEI